MICDGFIKPQLLLYKDVIYDKVIFDVTFYYLFADKR